MHIRQVLVKAELEKFQQYKDIYNALKKGKVEKKKLSSGFRLIFPDYRSHLPQLVLFSLALLFVSDQEVLPLYLVLHLPVLQKVN